MALHLEDLEVFDLLSFDTLLTMRLILLPISFFLSLSIAAQAVDNPLVTPVITAVELTVSQFGIVLTDIRRFDGSRDAGEKLLRHFEETISNVDDSISRISRLPSTISWNDAASIANTGTPLTDRVLNLKKALAPKKGALDNAQLGGKLFQLLDHSQYGMIKFGKLLRDKAPPLYAMTIKPIHDRITASLGESRELFRDSPPPSPAPIVIVIEGGQPRQIDPNTQWSGQLPQGGQNPQWSNQPNQGDRNRPW